MTYTPPSDQELQAIDDASKDTSLAGQLTFNCSGRSYVKRLVQYVRELSAHVAFSNRVLEMLNSYAKGLSVEQLSQIDHALNYQYEKHFQSAVESARSEERKRIEEIGKRIMTLSDVERICAEPDCGCISERLKQIHALAAAIEETK